MKYLVIISTLFVIGSLIGWIIELFLRRFVSQKKWMNPGFLTGPIRGNRYLLRNILRFLSLLNTL